MFFSRKKKSPEPEKPPEVPKRKRKEDTFIPDEYGDIVVDGRIVCAELYHHQMNLFSFLDDDISDLYRHYAGRILDTNPIRLQLARDTRKLTDAVNSLVIQIQASNNGDRDGGKGEDPKVFTSPKTGPRVKGSQDESVAVSIKNLARVENLTSTSKRAG